MTASALSSAIERQIDLLIDGELCLAEQRALAETLEQHPELWRRLALGFWENQALEREAPLALSAAPTLAAPMSPTRAAANWPRAAWNLALAASVLVAFGLGWAANSSVPPAGVAPLAAPEDGWLVDAASAGLAPRHTTLRPAGLARMAFDQEGQRHTYEAPIYQGDAAAAQAWLEQLPPAIDPRLTAELERRGQRIQRQVGLVPVRLENGMQAAVPVDAYRIVPVKGPAY